MKQILYFSGILILFSVVFLSQCSEPHVRYEDPPWLGGSNIETLENQSNYQIFLQLMDRADYRVSIENQLFTLFVPSDSAFEAYFDELGISDVDELPVKAAEELFGQHILINPRSREQLMYEYAWGELQDPKGEYGALFHKKETYAVPLDYEEYVKYNPEYRDQSLLLYRGNTMIPLFTTEYFEDYFGDPDGSDYLFIYPGSSWSGTQWHDAMVTEAEVRTSSGFIYYLDRVVRPVKTIETYLKDKEEFSLFYDIAQRFATYNQGPLNENQVRTYHKSYNQILDFANEEGPDPGSPQNMLYSFSAFVPYNNVLQEFLDNTVLKSYPSLDSVPQLFLVYMLQSHLNSFLMLPSKMEDHFQNYYGDRLDVNINSDIATARMCGNGVVYAMNRMLEPNAFTCVPGPVFYNKSYTTFLYALEESGLLNTLTRPDVEMTLFAPSNSQLLKYGIRYNIVDNDVFIEIRNTEGNWMGMQELDIQEFVQDYIYEGNVEDFSGTGYLRMTSDNYIYYNNGTIVGGGNQAESDVCEVIEKKASEKNGNLYYINNSIKAPLNAAEFILSDPSLFEFGKLLSKADLVDSVQAFYEEDGVKYPRLSFMAEDRQWTIFAPTNNAIIGARYAGLIPTEQKELRNFIYYHFLRGTSIFDNGDIEGSFPTHCIDTIIDVDVYYKTIDVSNTPEDLRVEDLSGVEKNVLHENANFLIEGGVLHKINSVLSNKSSK